MVSERWHLPHPFSLVIKSDIGLGNSMQSGSESNFFPLVVPSKILMRLKIIDPFDEVFWKG